jgi:nucleoside-diphosphate-sugar epimerase
MKYFITGATGFVGNVLTRQLLAQGHQVNAIVRDLNKAAELKKKLGCDLFTGDITDKESMRAATQGVIEDMSVVEKIIPVPETYTSEDLRVIAGVTYIGDNSKAKRKLGYNPHPFREGWEQTLRHEMSLLGMK